MLTADKKHHVNVREGPEGDTAILFGLRMLDDRFDNLKAEIWKGIGAVEFGPNPTFWYGDISMDLKAPCCATWCLDRGLCKRRRQESIGD